MTVVALRKAWRPHRVVVIRPAPLRRKARAVLEYLRERSDRYVSSEELMAHFWPRCNPAVCYQTMTEVRDYLASPECDAPGQHIETMATVGYRLVRR